MAEPGGAAKAIRAVPEGGADQGAPKKPKTDSEAASAEVSPARPCHTTTLPNCFFYGTSPHTSRAVDLTCHARSWFTPPN